jgi:hypothetical protein
MRIIRPTELSYRLAQFQKSHELPGLKTRKSQARFVEKLFDSEKKLRALSMRNFGAQQILLDRIFTH